MSVYDWIFAFLMVVVLLQSSVVESPGCTVALFTVIPTAVLTLYVVRNRRVTPFLCLLYAARTVEDFTAYFKQSAYILFFCIDAACFIYVLIEYLDIRKGRT